MVSLRRTLQISAMIPDMMNLGEIGVNFIAKGNGKIWNIFKKNIIMMGSIGPTISNFDVKEVLGNTQDIFYLMGNSMMLRITFFSQCVWDLDKQMALR